MFLERKGRIFQGRVLHSPHDSQHVDTFFLHFLITRLLVGGGVVVCANTHAEDKQIPSGRLFFFFFKSSFRRWRLLFIKFTFRFTDWFENKESLGELERCGLWQTRFLFSRVLKWFKSPVCQYMAARYLIAKGEKRDRQIIIKKKKTSVAGGDAWVNVLSLSALVAKSTGFLFFFLFSFLKFHLISSYRRRLRLPDNRTHFFLDVYLPFTF